MSEVAANLAKALLRTPRDVALCYDELRNGSSPQVKAVCREMLSQPGLPLPRDCPLTSTQLEIVGDLMEGLTVAEIAAKRVVEYSTVRTQLSLSYRRLGVSERSQAVITCYREGWII